MQVAPRVRSLRRQRPPLVRLATPREVVLCAPPPFGFGLGLAGRAGKAASVFDPATLSLTFWVRASYSASPWTGTASAGSSGSRDLTEATNPPAAGTAVNGFTPADYDGVNDWLSNATAISTLLSASAWSCWALVLIDAVALNFSSPFSNDCVGNDTGQFWGIHLKENGGSPLVQVYQWDGAEKKAEASISTGAWALIQGKYDGANIKARVNGGSWVSAAAGNISTLTGSLRVGAQTSTTPMNGKMLEFALAATALSDGTFDDVKSYCNSRYALSL